MTENDTRTQVLWRDAGRAWRLLIDPAVPLAYKAVPFLGLLYVLSPVDLLPDFFIGLGQIDDVAILLLSLRLFLELAGKERTAAPPDGGEPPPASTVTTTYRVADEDP